MIAKSCRTKQTVQCAVPLQQDDPGIGADQNRGPQGDEHAGSRKNGCLPFEVVHCIGDGIAEHDAKHRDTSRGRARYREHLQVQGVVEKPLIVCRAICKTQCHQPPDREKETDADDCE